MSYEEARLFLFLFLLFSFFMPYTTVWYKTRLSRITIWWTTLILLFLLNYQLFVMRDMWTLFSTVVFGYIAWIQLRVMNSLTFTFGYESIVIALPSNKSYTLKKQDIQSIQRVSFPRRKVWTWTKYSMITGMMHFTTSHHNLLRITMKDEAMKDILISPRIIKQEVLDQYA